MKYQEHAWSPKIADLPHAEIRPIGSPAQSQSPPPSAFDFSAFCKAGRSPRPAFSIGSNFEQVQRQANYATAHSSEISPADPVWMPVIRKTFTRADPTLRAVAHCLRNRNIPHEVFTDAEEAFYSALPGLHR